MYVYNTIFQYILSGQYVSSINCCRFANRLSGVWPFPKYSGTNVSDGTRMSEFQVEKQKQKQQQKKKNVKHTHLCNCMPNRVDKMLNVDSLNPKSLQCFVLIWCVYTANFCMCNSCLYEKLLSTIFHQQSFGSFHNTPIIHLRHQHTKNLSMLQLNCPLTSNYFVPI